MSKWDYKVGNYSPQVLALADSDLDAVETVILYPYSTVEIEKTERFFRFHLSFFNPNCRIQVRATCFFDQRRY